MTRRIFALLILLSLAHPAMAEDLLPDNIGDNHTAPAVEETHPIYSSDSHWAGALIVGIAGLFLAAAIIGAIVRAESPQAVPDAMSHEEDPAVDRH